jgi:CRISPR-associated protein Csm1
MILTGKNIVDRGIDLLSKGQISIDTFAMAFSIAGVEQKELKLVSLQSSFGGDKFFEPTVLVATEINYPLQDSVTDFSKLKPNANEKGLTALERYGSFVATDADAKISVFDLFKTAAAIQDCLDKGLKQNPFLLVSCDFSGIQDTVYTISSKGALKTLRARSFMLELLTEHIVYEILEASGSERHAIIYSGGGGFSLLLPNTNGLKDTIELYGNILNRWAYKEFSGKFFIALDALSFDLTSTPLKEAKEQQHECLEKLKQQKFLNQLEILFQPEMPKQLTVQTECQITRRDDLEEDEMRDLESGKLMKEVLVQERDNEKWTWVSQSCYHQYRLGDKLIGATTIFRYEEQPKNYDGYITLKDRSDKEVYYSVERIGKVACAWQINLWQSDLPTILYADYVRTIKQLPVVVQSIEEELAKEESRKFESGHTATFNGLASSSCGADLIGSLRMDVDNMGKLFSDIGKLTELSAKSRMLNIFFKVYLNQFCKANLGKLKSGEELFPIDIVGKNYFEQNIEGENKGRNVSVIYAGGDDLFILGAWDETAELAFDIQRCFALFTGGIFDAKIKSVSGGLGISGGLTLHQPKFPLYQMAKKSGEAEDVAKHAKISKNCFTPFLLSLDDADTPYGRFNNKPVRVIDWCDAAFFRLLTNLVALTVKHKTENQINSITLDALSKGFIYKLFETAKVWATDGVLYLPRLRYVFSRLEKEYDNIIVYKIAIQHLQGQLFSPFVSERENAIKRMSLVLNWFEQLQRSR